jgi:hypothetical protein
MTSVCRLFPAALQGPTVLCTLCLQVFSIGEEVKETNDSGFLGTVPTLHTQLLADGSMLQVQAVQQSTSQ